MEQKKTILRGRLDGRQRNRLKRLLDMDYKPSELANEIGIDTEQIYKVYVPLGLPHSRDINRKISINGIIFNDWYVANYPKTKIENNEAFCKTCKQAVLIRNPTRKKGGNIEYLVMDCPNCGRRISKIITCVKGRHEYDQ